MLKRFLMPMMALALLLLVVGCSNTPSGNDDQTNLSDEFGGYTATDEAPGFGDPDLVGLVDEEDEIDDPILNSAEVMADVNDVNAGVFHFRAIWGRLRYDSTSTTPTDWTGSLTASRGSLVIRRLIRFELNQDGYFPRTDPEVIDWFSTTTVHNDGIAVDFYVPPVDPEVDTSIVVDSLGDTTIIVDTLPVDPVTLTFETGPYSQTFTLDELAQLSEVVNLPDSNGVAFHSIQIYRNACGRGVLTGEWGYDEDGNGVFRGIWMAREGVVGYLRGHFGEDSTGNRMFWGKWISRGGQFEGFVRGTWSSNVSHNASEQARVRATGQFRGEIYDANGDSIGALHGQYKSAGQRGHGWFGARWKLHCNDDPGDSGNANDNDNDFDDGF